MNGSNVESWVTAVEGKLTNIVILTILDLVGYIPTINYRLFQVGHVPMFIQTLAIMSRERILRIRIPDESSYAAYNAQKMTSYFRSVVRAKGITGVHVKT